jgi:amidase
MDDPWRLSAREAKAALDRRQLRAIELVESCLARIGAEDGGIKAFITLCGERALAEARASDARRRAGEDPRPLEGLPFAAKDVTPTEGVRTTYGSLVYADNVPAADELCIARLRRAGAILIGKSNTPEFGFGPRSVNPLRGPTANPHDRRLSSGSSSGGSAAAVACGMVPLAQGTDFGGSVRTPASFCGVVGVRPTPGLMPVSGKAIAWNALSSHGVLARTVDDAALMLSVMAGFDPRDPLSHPDDDGRGLASIADLERTPRLAFSADLGVAPVSAAVRAEFSRAVSAIAACYPGAEEAAPNCAEASEAFAVLRAALVHRQFADLVARHRNILTEPFVWNVDRGAGITAEEFLMAEEQRSRTYAAFVAFFDRYDFLLTPSASVLPFSNTLVDVVDIDGRSLSSPIDYLAITFIISLVGMPSLSIPCRWTDAGIPFGLQIVAPPHADARLLAFARELEHELGFRHRWPVLPENHIRA